jgi:GDP-L-fucose synthase
MYNNAKILVAGGTGTIGIPLVKLLLSRGARVTVVALEKEEIIRKKLPIGADYKQLDLTIKENCLLAVKNQEIIFNLMGIKGSVGIGEKKVASYLVPMLRFQTNLMEAAFEIRAKRFLFVGSICSYPQASYHHEDSIWNGMPKQNDRIPGIAKRVGELLGEAYFLEYGWDAVRVVRPANVYGPYDDFDPRTAQVIPSLISRICSGENPLVVWGDGTAVRDFIFADDVAYWLAEAAENAPYGLPINIGSGSGISIENLIEVFKKVFPDMPRVIWDKSKPTGDPCRVLSIERAQNLIAYNQQTTLYEGLRKTAIWYQTYYGGSMLPIINNVIN